MISADSPAVIPLRLDDDYLVSPSPQYSDDVAHYDAGPSNLPGHVYGQLPYSPSVGSSSWPVPLVRGRLEPSASSVDGDDDIDGSGHARKKVKPGLGRNLSGNVYVAGVRVPAMDSVMGLWFLFKDLTVRYEGTYSLRFRCYDITAAEPGSGIPAPLLVECRSQAFKVYSPRNFPGLAKPTELAEHFAKQGFKLNTRKNERQAESPPSPRAEWLPVSIPDFPDFRPLQWGYQSGLSTEGSSTDTTGMAVSAGTASTKDVARTAEAVGAVGAASTAGKTGTAGKANIADRLKTVAQARGFF